MTRPHASAPRFRRQWRGYDRTEVDAFLAATAADRERLRDNLKRIEDLLATCERPATKTTHSYSESSEPNFLSEPSSPIRTDRRRRTLLTLAFAAACVSVVVALNSRVDSDTPSAVERVNTPTATAPASRSRLAQTLPAKTQASPLQTAAPHAADLTMTLAAQRACWISTLVDGAQPMERLLKPGESLMLHAREEVLLKIGDAGAVSLVINNRSAKPLGRDGEVVTKRIKRTNYSSFLNDSF